MGTVNHPFPELHPIDIIKKLPYWFGEGIDSLELSLSDSTNGKRIVIPGRGVNCDHVDVVDVVNSTGASVSGSLEWMCPVCGLEYSDTSEIEVDGLVLDILSDLNKEENSESVCAVNVDCFGNWSHVSNNPEERLPMRRKKRNRLTLGEVKRIGNYPIDVDEGSEVDSPASGKKIGMIDLLEDSDED